jgi:hypothetical protein
MCHRQRPHCGRASFANGQNFREVGLHHCPSERKGDGVPDRRLPVPSHVPLHAQTAAKVRGFSPTAPGCTAEIDSLLEGDGFEPSVPARELRSPAARRSPFFRVAMVRAKPSLKTRNVDVKNPSAHCNVLDLGSLSLGSFWIIGGYQRRADGGGVGDQGKPADAMLQGQGKLRSSEPFARLDGEREVPKATNSLNWKSPKALARFGRMAVRTEERHARRRPRRRPGDDRRNRGGG